MARRARVSPVKTGQLGDSIMFTPVENPSATTESVNLFRFNSCGIPQQPIAINQKRRRPGTTTKSIEVQEEERKAAALNLRWKELETQEKELELQERRIRLRQAERDLEMPKEQQSSQ